jgi:hypothetical protein
MHHIAHATPQLTLASLGLRWLVLMVIIGDGHRRLA